MDSLSDYIRCTGRAGAALYRALLAVILILAGLAGCGAPPPAPSTPTPPPLAEIDYRNVPNFKNISANFRDLTYDPGNRHTIPYTWGTTGLVVRSDLAAEPVTHWADLWDTRYAGRVAIWDLPRHSLGLALKSF